MGTPQFAVPALAALTERFDVVAVVTQPDAPAGRERALTASPVKQFALEHHLPVLQPETLKPPEVVAQLRAYQPDGVLDQLADHALHVPAVVADFGVLGGFDFDKWRTGERGQPAGDFRLADAGGADHQNVFGGDLFTKIVVELLPTPAVANGDGDGPFGVVLADDMAVEFGYDLAGRQVTHGCSHLLLATEGTEITEKRKKNTNKR